MADITSTTLNVSSPEDGWVSAHVEVGIYFSPREVEEDFDYGVNLLVIVDVPDVSLFTRHKGMTAMELHTIPQNAVVLLKPMSAHEVIKPRASVTVSFDVENTDQHWPSGTKLQAVVTVVPEIAETTNFSLSTPVPLPLPSRRRLTDDEARNPPV